MVLGNATSHQDSDGAVHQKGKKSSYSTSCMSESDRQFNQAVQCCAGVVAGHLFCCQGPRCRHHCHSFPEWQGEVKCHWHMFCDILHSHVYYSHRDRGSPTQPMMIFYSAFPLWISLLFLTCCFLFIYTIVPCLVHIKLLMAVGLLLKHLLWAGTIISSVQHGSS